MKIRDILNEGMSFTPSKSRQTSDGIYLDWVFPGNWQPRYLWKSIDDEEPSENPEYRPEWNLDLSNANAKSVMDELGFEGDEHYAIPIDEFINRCQQWLRRNVGKRSQEVPTTVSKGRGADVDYSFLAARLKSELLKQHGEYWRQMWNSSPIWQREYPNVDDYLEYKATRRANSEIQSRKNRDDQHRTGTATMYSVGVPEGYYNRTIMKALRIAQEGKQHGADYMSVA